MGGGGWVEELVVWGGGVGVGVWGGGGGVLCLPADGIHHRTGRHPKARASRRTIKVKKKKTTKSKGKARRPRGDLLDVVVSNPSLGKAREDQPPARRA